MTNSTDVEKASDKIQNSHKSTQQIRTGRELPQPDKGQQWAAQS